MHFPSWLPFFPTALTRGELIAALAFLVLNLAVLAARVHRSLGRGAKKLVFLYEKSAEPIPAISFQALEVWALTIGILAILNMGWYLMLPIARRSVLLEIMGAPGSALAEFEPRTRDFLRGPPIELPSTPVFLRVPRRYAIKWHRWIGAYTVLLIFIHSIMYFIVWIHGNGHPTYDPEGWMLRQNLVACNFEEVDATCTEDQNIMLRRNWYGIVSTLATIVIAITSLSVIRRKYFELFYYAHHLFLVILLFVCLHYKSAIICEARRFEPVGTTCTHPQIGSSLVRPALCQTSSLGLLYTWLTNLAASWPAVVESWPA